MPPSVSDPAFWNDLYRAGNTGWDRGRPAPPIVRMLDAGLLPAAASVVVLGAGRGHEAVALAQRGYAVTAVDFAEEAARATRLAAAEAGVQVEVLEADLFRLPQLRPGAFDAALEHTCFCAIDPLRRAEYVEAIHSVLRPGGILFGLFFAHGRPGGPPFTTTEEEVRVLFTPRFAIDRLAVAPDSFTERQGQELELVFRRRAHVG